MIKPTLRANLKTTLRANRNLHFAPIETYTSRQLKPTLRANVRTTLRANVKPTLRSTLERRNSSKAFLRKEFRLFWVRIVIA